jgi:hypothetical protein
MTEDEFRVEVDLDEPEHGLGLGERLRALDLDEQARERLGGPATVTRDGSHLFVYTASREAAAEAARALREVLAEDELSGEIRTTRWHPIAEEWKDAVEPLPADEEARAAELREKSGHRPQDHVEHPALVFIESYKPRFLRDLGL